MEDESDTTRMKSTFGIIPIRIKKFFYNLLKKSDPPNYEGKNYIWDYCSKFEMVNFQILFTAIRAIRWHFLTF